jgi:polysaccharide biosynthesis/export protein
MNRFLALVEGPTNLAALEHKFQSLPREKLWKTNAKLRQSRVSKLHHCAKLLGILANYSQGLSMKSGTTSLTRRCRMLLFLVSAILGLAASGAVAQQSTGTQPNPSSPPAVLPAGKPVSDAAVSASGAAPQAKPSDATKDTADDSLVKLGVGDLIEVSVYNVPELSTKARVSNSGDVYLPLIDYVHVEGLTQEEAQALIEKRLEDGGFVRSPHVTIFVDDAASQGVTVLGEVFKPGIYPDVADHKLYALISEAGGFTQSASRKIAIIRPGKAEPIHIDLPRNLGDDLSGNVDVSPGDTITVPRAPIIYVVGDVGRPSGLLVDNGTLTVLQALALAGGTNHTAKMGGVRIIRRTPSGMTETRIELKKMLEAKAPDVTLQADDILFVPISGFRVAAARTADAAVTAAAAVSIYAVHP